MSTQKGSVPHPECTAADARLRSDLLLYMENYIKELNCLESLPAPGRWKRFMSVFLESLSDSFIKEDLAEDPSPADLLPVFGNYAACYAQAAKLRSNETDLVLDMLLPAPELIISETDPVSNLILDLSSTIILDDICYDMTWYDRMSLVSADLRDELQKRAAMPSGTWEQSIRTIWEEICITRPGLDAAICHPFQLVLRRSPARRYFERAISNRLASAGQEQKSADVIRKSPKEVINQKCAEFGLTLKDVCERAQPRVNSKTLKRILDGETTRVSSRKAVADGLGISLKELEPCCRPERRTEG